MLFRNILCPAPRSHFQFRVLRARLWTRFLHRLDLLIGGFGLAQLFLDVRGRIKIYAAVLHVLDHGCRRGALNLLCHILLTQRYRPLGLLHLLVGGYLARHLLGLVALLRLLLGSGLLLLSRRARRRRPLLREQTAGNT